MNALSLTTDEAYGILYDHIKGYEVDERTILLAIALATLRDRAEGYDGMMAERAKKRYEQERKRGKAKEGNGNG